MKQAMTWRLSLSHNASHGWRDRRNATKGQGSSIQEAVYILMPELCLHYFPGVIFANSNLPDNRFRICRSKEEIDELPEDSVDIFKRNIDRYIDRPNHPFSNGKFSVLDNLCYL